MFGLLGSGDVSTGSAGLPVWTGRRLDQVYTEDLIDRIGSLREEVAQVRAQLTRESIPETTLGALAAALDHTTRLITGDDARAARPGRTRSAVLARRCA